jgi:hypothetical protein
MPRPIKYYFAHEFAWKTLMASDIALILTRISTCPLMFTDEHSSKFLRYTIMHSCSTMVNMRKSYDKKLVFEDL